MSPAIKTRGGVLQKIEILIISDVCEHYFVMILVQHTKPVQANRAHKRRHADSQQ